MDIYIYFGQVEDIGDLEDRIDEVLGDRGEVTGSGIGVSGGNIDIELYDETMLEYFLDAIRELEFLTNTYYVIDGIRKAL